MKTLFFTLFICLLSNFIIAQALEWGETFKTAKANTLSSIIGEDESGFYALERGPTKGGRTIYGIYTPETTEYFLLKFDNEANLVKKADLLLKDKGEKARQLETVEFINNELLVFTSVLSQDKSKKLLVRETLDKNTFQRKGEKKVITSALGNGKKARFADFFFEFSPQKNYYVVEKRDNRTKEGVLNSEFFVYDSRHELDWSKKVSQQKDPQFKQNWNSERVLDLKLDEDGNYYTLEFEYGDKKNRKDGYYEIAKYTKGVEKPLIYKPSLSTKSISNLQFNVQMDGNIRCVGFYSNENFNGFDGIYSILLDGESGDITHTNLKEFDIDFITQNKSDKYKEKLEKKQKKGKDVTILYRYELDDLIVREDGTSQLLGERFYTTTHTYTYTSNGVTYTSTYTNFHADDIIVVEFDKLGDIRWMKQIPKRQTSRSPAYISYVEATKNNMTYLVFNDCSDNKGITEGGVNSFPCSRKNTSIMVLSINKDGEMERKELHKYEDFKTGLRPLLSLQLKKTDDLFLFAERKKNMQFGKVKF